MTRHLPKKEEEIAYPVSIATGDIFIDQRLYFD